MQIGSSLNTGAYAALTPTSSSSTSSASSAASDPLMAIAPSGNSSDDIMKFLKMTPAQKMQYEWMSSHHVTQQSLASMTQDQRDALQEQMSADLKQKAQQATEAKAAKAGGVQRGGLIQIRKRRSETIRSALQLRFSSQL